MTTALKADAAVHSSVRQRQCLRPACMETTTRQPNVAKVCCDESCIVEVARRECDNEHGKNSRKASPQPKGNDCLVSAKCNPEAGEQPCDGHLKETKRKYSGILDNLGCICKVLLSLNIEPCCVIPSHASSRSKTSKGVTRVFVKGPLHEAVTVKDPTKPPTCAVSTCCTGNRSSPLSGTNPEERDLRPNDNCSAMKPKELIDEVVTHSKCPSSTNCQRRQTIMLDRTNHGIVSIKSHTQFDSRNDNCSSRAESNYRVHGSGLPVDTCCGEGTRSGEQRLKASCCSAMSSSCDSTDGIAVARPVPELSGSSSYGLDIEKGFLATEFRAEFFKLAVLGMTCTGCETRLETVLKSLPGVSSVKINYLASTAEFNLMESTSVDSDDIIKKIERRTGYTCRRIAVSGEELDIILLDLDVLSSLPAGVLNMTILNKKTNLIRLTYDPRIVGARELLSNPIFSSAKLARQAVSPSVVSGRTHFLNELKLTILSVALTVPVLILAYAPLPERNILYGAISLVLATIIQTIIAGKFYVTVFNAIRFSTGAEMELLIVLSSTTAYIYSIVAYGFLAAGKPLVTGQFFETSTLLVTLIMVGRAISTFARQRATETISINSLQAEKALLIQSSAQDYEEIDSRLLQYNDSFKVLPDTKIVTDGIITTGESEIDESSITGETKPILKKPGMSVIAGSVNQYGILSVRLTRLPCENTIKDISDLVQKANASKGRIREIADRVAARFIPLILIITVIVFGIWVGIGVAIRHQSATTACIVAMTYAISALIVSCPCAIGMAVPMVVAIAGGVAAKNGIIFKEASTIETARKVSHVIFDKTGTLTHGKLSVITEDYIGVGYDGLLPMILAFTSNSKHPVSSAVSAHLREGGHRPGYVEFGASVAGKGLEARWNNLQIRAGDPYWLGFEDHPRVAQNLSLGFTILCICVENTLVAVYSLTDNIRSDAAAVISQLQARSIQVSLVSGDNDVAVRSVASRLNIPQTHVRSRCSPADKAAYVRNARLSGTESGDLSIVMFCGDGTNDAVALKEATIGMHMNGGTDIAQSAADAVLINPSLRGILTLIDLSKAFYARVAFNFGWAFTYNVIAILLAAGAFPNVRIEPQYAGLGEVVSVLPVVAVALQLKWATFQ